MLTRVLRACLEALLITFVGLILVVILGLEEIIWLDCVIIERILSNIRDFRLNI